MTDAAIFADERPRLVRFALSLTRNPEEAEDLAQEAIVKALRSIDRYEGRAGPYPYLCRITQNAWIDRVKKRRRLLTLSLDQSPCEHPVYEHSYLADYVPEYLARKLELLRPEYREPFLMHHMEDLEYPEIAAGLGLPIGTVKSRINRAKVALRRQLNPN